MIMVVASYLIMERGEFDSHSGDHICDIRAQQGRAGWLPPSCAQVRFLYNAKLKCRTLTNE